MPDTSPCPSPDIYESDDALNAYLQNVRERREQRVAKRLERERLCIRLGKVEEELSLTIAPEDADLAAELTMVLEEFHRRLSLLNAPLLPRFPVLPSANDSVPLPAHDETEGDTLSLKREQDTLPENLPIPAANDDSAANPVLSNPVEISVAVTHQREPEQPVEQEPMVEPADRQEASASLADLQAHLTTLENTWEKWEREREQTVNLALNIPVCLHSRAIACSLHSLTKSAARCGFADAVANRVSDLSYRIVSERDNTDEAGTCLPLVAFADDQKRAKLSVEEWEELAALYHDAAEAAEVWDWFCDFLNTTGNSPNLINAIANAIAARQRRLDAALKRYNAKDCLLYNFIGNLRALKNKTGILNAIDSDTPANDLKSLAGNFDHLITQAKNKIKTEQKKAVLDALIAHCQKGIIITPITLDKERNDLFPLLDACLEAGIPPSNPAMRDALLDIAPVLMKHVPKYEKILEFVEKERQRRGLDVLPEQDEHAEEPDIADNCVIKSKEYVKTYTASMKILVLGGVPASQPQTRLREILHQAEVEWAECKKHDRIGKFKAQIEQTEMLILIKNFASHELTVKGRELAKKHKIDFVLLPSGYGANQIIHQIYEQIVSRKNSAL